MALIASVLIGVGIANFDLVKSFLLEGSFAGEEALAKRAKAQRALSLGCSTKDNLIDKDVDEAGTEITLCPQSGVIFLFGKHRHSLAFEFSPDFKRENKDILKKFPLSRFARIDAPMTFPGSIAYSWRLLPIVSNPEAGFVSAFEATGLEFVKITARSIRH